MYNRGGVVSAWYVIKGGVDREGMGEGRKENGVVMGPGVKERWDVSDSGVV